MFFHSNQFRLPKDWEKFSSNSEILYATKKLKLWFNKNWKNSSSVFHSNQFILPKKPRIVFNNILITHKQVVSFFKYIHYTNLKRDVNIRSSCSNLSMVSYITKSLKEVLSPYICFSYYKLRLRYRVILCRRDSESKKVSGVQKRDIWMISGAK